jgi:hypothetical protein
MQDADNKRHASGNCPNLSESVIPIVQPFGQRVHIPTSASDRATPKARKVPAMFAEFDS